MRAERECRSEAPVIEGALRLRSDKDGYGVSAVGVVETEALLK